MKLVKIKILCILLFLSCSSIGQSIEKKRIHTIFDTLQYLSKKVEQSKTAEEVKNNLKILISGKNQYVQEFQTLYETNFSHNYKSFDSTIQSNVVKTPLLYFLWIEEGTKPFLSLNWTRLETIAKKTKGKEDDDYFDLKKQLYNEFGDISVTMPVWIVQYTDISGASRLGDGIYSTILNKINTLQSKDKNLFKEEYKAQRSVLLDDLTGMGSFEYTKPVVLEELKTISNFSYLSPQEKNAVNLFIKKINTSQTFQYDCKSGKCHFE